MSSASDPQASEAYEGMKLAATALGLVLILVVVGLLASL